MMWRMWLPGGWYDNKKNSALAPIGKKQGEWVAGHNLVGVSPPTFTDISLVRRKGVSPVSRRSAVSYAVPVDVRTAPDRGPHSPCIPLLGECRY